MIRLRRLPELHIATFAFLLNFVWEVLQTPFFIDISPDINTIVWFRLHCTFGDVMISLGSFWLVSLIFKNRLWLLKPSKMHMFLFIMFGMSYTIFSEILNVSIKDMWGYSDLMPVIPFIGVGVVPLIQWIATPPLLIFFAKKQLCCMK
jgi:hypothetical protein